jgi:hypothetical protein
MPTWKVLTDTDGNKIVVNLDLVMKVSRYEDAVWGIHAHICAMIIAFTFGSARGSEGISVPAADWRAAMSLFRSNMESRVLI